MVWVRDVAGARHVAAAHADVIAGLGAGGIRVRAAVVSHDGAFEAMTSIFRRLGSSKYNAKYPGA